MPWSVDDERIKSLPKKGRELWVKVANAHLASHPGEEVSAIRVAWHAVGQAGLKKNGHRWEYTLDKTLALSEMEKMMKHPNMFFSNAPMSFYKSEEAGGKKYVILKASGLDVDKQDERMTKEAIAGMVQQAKEGKIELLDQHRSSFSMGKSVDGWADSNSDYFVKFEADMRHAHMPQLMDDLSKNDFGKYQASVGGRVKEFAREFNKGLGKVVKVLKEVDLNHIAITRWQDSAYPSAGFVGAVCKEIGGDEPSASELGGGDFVKEKIELLMKAIGELVDSASVKVNASMDMFAKGADGVMTLKKEFEGIFTKDASLDDAQKAEIKKGVERLNALLGVVVAPKTEKSAEEIAAEKAAQDSLKKDFEEKLKKANEALEEMKKDSSTSKTALQEALIKVKALEQVVEKVASLPATPRAGAGEVKVEKTETPTSGSPAAAAGLEKGGMALLEKANAHAAECQALVKSMAKLKQSGETLSAEQTEKAMKASEFLMEAAALGNYNAALRKGIITQPAA